MLPKAAEALRTVGDVIASRQSKQGDRSLNLGLAPKTLFNVAITNQRSYATLETSLTDLKELGRRAGGTVNTVVMAMCAAALRKFLHRSQSAAAPIDDRARAGQPALGR